jgi:plasmid stabilization system protein ParE
MKAWDELPPPIPPPRLRPTFSPAARRSAPPLECLVGIWLDAGAAARGASPLPSSILIEGERWFAADPEYPGGFLAETVPEMLVPWSEEAERDLDRIARSVNSWGSGRAASYRGRVVRAAGRVAADTARRCSGPEEADVVYDVGRCAVGALPVPCRRDPAEAGTVAEVTGNASIVPSRWRAQQLVAETEDNRALLMAFARRVQRALATAERLADRAAATIGLSLVRDYLAARVLPDARLAPREQQFGPQVEDGGPRAPRP